MDIATLLLLLVALVGLVGTIIPGLPGAVLIFAAALVYAIVTDFQTITAPTLWTLGLLTAGTEGAGYLATGLVARRYGAGRAGALGGSVGLLIGLIVLGPIGLLVGPLVGAIGAEMITGRPLQKALDAGIGAVLGGVSGLILRFTLSLVMVIIVVRTLFF